MRAGQIVTYVSPGGARSAACVTEVQGAGPSGFKRLSLTHANGTAVDVLYQEDAPKGVGFWTFEPFDLPEAIPSPPTVEPQADTTPTTDKRAPLFGRRRSGE